MKTPLIMRCLITVGLFTAVPYSTASSNGFEARNAAMGGTGTASATFGAAALVNPALLAKSTSSNKITLIAPTIGAQASDADHLVDRFDDVKNAWDKLADSLATGATSTATDAGTLNNLLTDIVGTSADVKASLSMLLAVPDDSLPIALFINTWGKGTAQPLISQSDLDYLEGISNGSIIPGNDALDKLTSRAEGMIALITEYGVSLAHPFTLGKVPMGIGFTPKIQRIETWNYNVAVNNYDSSDFSDGNWQNQTLSGNIDVGMYADLSSNWTVALSAQNLIEQRFKTREVNGTQTAFVIRPQVTAGSAWTQNRVTLSTDFDLTPVSDFEAVDKRQYAAVGAELRATNWSQVRAGYRVDMRGNDHRQFTAGFGLSPSENVQFDLSAMAGRMRTIGGVAELTFKF
jgi:hypothetical protein